ncbi:MAG: flagellar basal body rod protein FlgC [Gammaproteobacteria bacterium]|nr:flagellar basal body rod protein FlgC [Gammaproteobacteria bacterium]
MALFNIFDIAGSAMSSQSVRLNTTASNLANADSISSSINKTYRARHPVFATVMRDTMSRDSFNAGVRIAGIIESQAPLQKVYKPEHPQADESGYIFLPNVNVMEEMANMISASRSYQNNVEVINASKDMLLRTLTLGQR